MAYIKVLNPIIINSTGAGGIEFDPSVNSGDLLTKGVGLTLIPFSYNRIPIDDVDYLITGNEHRLCYIALTAPRTVTIPNALLGTGLEIYIKDEVGLSKTHNIIIQPEAGTLIDGAAFYKIAIDYGHIIVYDAITAWGIN